MMSHPLKITRRHLPLIALGLGYLLVFSYIVKLVFDVDITINPGIAALLRGQETTAETVDTPDALAAQLAASVIPEAGFTVPLKWGDVGQKLVGSGAIDLDKFKQNYQGEQYQELLTYLTDTKDQGITINPENAYFWVNVLWALGLTQQSDVLDKGIMATDYQDRLGNFASTAGWTLGSKDALALYSSVNFVTLSPEQQAQVTKVSANIYRPCCGNSAAFPDCNHGMAILGLVELMVAQGFSEAEIYKAALAFNSYWFAQTYTDLAYYFQTKENISWDKIDPKRVLSAEFSSASGYQNIRSQIEDAPALPGRGGSCGA